MSGVQRSKGCRGCRARKRKCGEQRPACDLCVRRQIECVYPSARQFVIVDVSRQNPSIKAKSPPASRPSAKVKPVSSPSDNSSDGFDIIGLPADCIASSYYSLTHGALLENYAPIAPENCHTGCSKISNSAGTSWLYTAYSHAHSDVLLADSMAALSLIYHERQNGLRDSALGSRELYVKAMSTLSHRLSTMHRALADSTLASALLLVAYEGQSSTKGLVDWYRHIEGVSTLINLRGQSNSRTEFGYQLYLGSRMLDLFSAIGKRKAVTVTMPSFPRSLDCPWTSYSQLFEILFTLPAILEAGDKAECAIETGTEVEVRALLSTFDYMCEEFRSRLGLWRTQLDNKREEDDTPLTWEEPSLLYHDLPPNSVFRIFDTFICFQSFDVAQQLVISWSCSLLVDSWRPLMQRKLENRWRAAKVPFQHDTDHEEVQNQCRTLAVRIAKSLEYFLQPHMGPFVSEFIAMPMSVGKGWWNMNDPTAKQPVWFQVIFTRLQEINLGFSEVVQLMAGEGGGGGVFRPLVARTESV